MSSKTCTACKLVLPLKMFGKRNASKDGLNYVCKTCTKHNNRRSILSGGRRVWGLRLHSKYTRLFRDATSRGHGTPTITKEEYFSLTEKPCHYCGSVIESVGSGLDRIDSSKGYRLDNVVPCCGTCNKMKNNLPIDEFKAHIAKIASRLSQF